MTVRGVNRVTLIGFLGQDPEIRYMPNGGAVANLSLATSESWRDKQTGETREKTEWHRVALFGKLAEVAGEYLRKGAQIYVEGQLRTRSWQDDSSNTRYITEIVVGQSGTMQMLGGRRDGGQPQESPQYSGQPQPAQPAQAASQSADGTSGAKKGRGKGKKAAAQPEPQPPQGEWPPVDDMDSIPF